MQAIVNNEPIILPGIGGRPPIEIDKKLLCQVIQPRMEEILEIASMEIKRSGYSKHLSAGAVLTGGGSLIKGTADLARDVLGMPVKIGIPSGFGGGLIHEIENPIYATGVGLVIHELKHRDRSAITVPSSNGKGKGSVKSIFNRMKTWFDEL
jgi:cell division protein FtsA